MRTFCECTRTSGKIRRNFRKDKENTEKRSAFHEEIGRYNTALTNLLNRGIGIYLTVALEDRLLPFNNFLFDSREATEPIYARVLSYQLGRPTIFRLGLPVDVNVSPQSGYTTGRGPRSLFPEFRMGFFGTSFTYTEELLKAPIESAEFERRILRDAAELRILIKEVTLGTHE